MHSPDILSQIFCHLGLLELDRLERCAALGWGGGVCEEERRVLRLGAPWVAARAVPRPARPAILRVRAAQPRRLRADFNRIPIWGSIQAGVNTFLPPEFGPLSRDRPASVALVPRAGSDRVVVGRQPNGVELSCPMGLACDGEHARGGEQLELRAEALPPDWKPVLGTGGTARRRASCATRMASR